MTWRSSHRERSGSGIARKSEAGNEVQRKFAQAAETIWRKRCTMRRASVLAAPQIGILKRVIVIDTGDENGLIEMVNPQIVERDGEQFGPKAVSASPA